MKLQAYTTINTDTDKSLLQNLYNIKDLLEQNKNNISFFGSTREKLNEPEFDKIISSISKNIANTIPEGKPISRGFDILDSTSNYAYHRNAFEQVFGKKSVYLNSNQTKSNCKHSAFTYVLYKIEETLKKELTDYNELDISNVTIRMGGKKIHLTIEFEYDADKIIKKALEECNERSKNISHDNLLEKEKEGVEIEL